MIFHFNLGAPGLSDLAEIDMLRDRCQLTLSNYVSSAYPDQPTRFGRLLLILGRLQRISPSAIEQAFFRNEIGDVPIETLIRNMFHSS